MNSFEGLVATIAAIEGYWVQTSLKVILTKEEKRQIGLPTSPRWEIDVVGYKGATNKLLVIECKSYLDSTGIKVKDLADPESPSANRYKLFTKPGLSEVVFSRLSTQLYKSGSCKKNPVIQLCLAAGKIATDEDRIQLRELFKKNGWLLWDDHWIKSRLEELAKSAYEDNPSIITAKMLLR